MRPRRTQNVPEVVVPERVYVDLDQLAEWWDMLECGQIAACQKEIGDKLVGTVYEKRFDSDDEVTEEGEGDEDEEDEDEDE